MKKKHLVASREPKPKLTDAERHKRFVEMAREVEADESPQAFDRAFMRVAQLAQGGRRQPSPPAPPPSRRAKPPSG